MCRPLWSYDIRKAYFLSFQKNLCLIQNTIFLRNSKWKYIFIFSFNCRCELSIIYLIIYLCIIMECINFYLNSKTCGFSQNADNLLCCTQRLALFLVLLLVTRIVKGYTKSGYLKIWLKSLFLLQSNGNFIHISKKCCFEIQSSLKLWMMSGFISQGWERLIDSTKIMVWKWFKFGALRECISNTFNVAFNFMYGFSLEAIINIFSWILSKL